MKLLKVKSCQVGIIHNTSLQNVNQYLKHKDTPHGDLSKLLFAILRLKLTYFIAIPQVILN